MAITKENEQHLQELVIDWSGPIWITNGRNDGEWTLENVVGKWDWDEDLTKEDFDLFTAQVNRDERCWGCACLLVDGMGHYCRNCGVNE